MNDHRPDLDPLSDPALDERGALGSEIALDLEQRLRALLPSLRVVDRDLELDGLPIADLVGQADGRLVLVLFVDGDGDPPVLAALDALAAARQDGELLAANLGLSDLGERAPLVLLVAERFGQRMRERLSAVPPDRLWLLERRGVRTARRDVRPLVRRSGEEGPGPGSARNGAPQASSAGAPRGASSGARSGALSGALAGALAGAPPLSEPCLAARFLARLEPATARLGRELVERIARVDPELVLELEGSDGREELMWSFRGKALCGLAVREGRLQGRLPGSPVPHAIHGPAAIGTFLDWVLTCHLELLDGLPERDDLGQVELVPPRREPLLTAEEIEAFRE
jgi:hypothetical protein